LLHGLLILCYAILWGGCDEGVGLPFMFFTVCFVFRFVRRKARSEGGCAERKRSL
jgi:hypothetical protein